MTKTIRSDASDDEVSAAVCVMLGYTFDEATSTWTDREGAVVIPKYRLFAADANAVLKLAEACRLLKVLLRPDETEIVLLTEDYKQGVFHDLAKHTFCRGLCFAYSKRTASK